MALTRRGRLTLTLSVTTVLVVVLVLLLTRTPLGSAVGRICVLPVTGDGPRSNAPARTA